MRWTAGNSLSAGDQWLLSSGVTICMQLNRHNSYSNPGIEILSRRIGGKKRDGTTTTMMVIMMMMMVRDRTPHGIITKGTF